MIANSEFVGVPEVLARHAERSFGTNGFREVLLTVWTKGQPSISYKVFHVWRTEAQSCSSLFFLNSPSPLRGTSVRLIEEPYLGPREVWLRLKNAEQPLRVAPSRFAESFLGTDFSYEDLCFWLPTRSLDVENLQIRSKPGTTEYCFSAKRTELPTATLRMTFEGRFWLPIRIEWLDPETLSPRKLYSASRLARVNGVWTPRVISVSGPAEQYKSEMVLQRASHSINVEADVFLNEHQAYLSASFFDRWVSTAHSISAEGNGLSEGQDHA